MTGLQHAAKLALDSDTGLKQHTCAIILVEFLLGSRVILCEERSKKKENTCQFDF